MTPDSPHTPSPSRITGMNLIGIGTLGVVALMIFATYAADDVRRWAAVAVIGALALLLIWEDRGIQRFAVRQVYYALAALALGALIALQANVTGFITIGFLLSGSVMASSTPRIGYLWILIFGAITLLYTMLIWPGNIQALLSALGILAGYIFMGATIDAQRKAERAEVEAQSLLARLQEAHAQLQQSAQQAEALAVAEERNRLAREVHDTLGHRLTVAAVQLEGAQRLIARDPDKAGQMVATVRTQVLEGLAELRRTVATLRSPLVADLGLTAALRHLARTFEEATTIAVELKLPETPPNLTPEQRQVCYRTAQEALTNVQRHAGAQHVRLEMACTPDGGVRLTITDDGRGLAPVHKPGFGLRGMTERAAQIGATLEIGNGALGGAHIALTLASSRAPQTSPHNELE